MTPEHDVGGAALADQLRGALHEAVALLDQEGGAEGKKLKGAALAVEANRPSRNPHTVEISRIAGR